MERGDRGAGRHHFGRGTWTGSMACGTESVVGGRRARAAAPGSSDNGPWHVPGQTVRGEHCANTVRPVPQSGLRGAQWKINLARNGPFTTTAKRAPPASSRAHMTPLQHPTNSSPPNPTRERSAGVNPGIMAPGRRRSDSWKAQDDGEKTEKGPLLWERRRNTARCGERAAAGGVLGPQEGDTIPADCCPMPAGAGHACGPLLPGITWPTGS